MCFETKVSRLGAQRTSAGNVICFPLVTSKVYACRFLLR